MPPLENLSRRTSESKRRVGKAFEINGVNAVEIDLKKSENLSDPILDLNFKLNNPVGRLWLAIKRIWKSQNTVISLKFTIPLIVLPIVLFVIWRIWQGRGVSVPMSKLGIIHSLMIDKENREILVLPTSDVYLLEYASAYEDRVVTEKPVIVIGTYKHLDNVLTVEKIVAYNTSDIIAPSSTTTTVRSTWDSILKFISQFK